MLEKIIGAFKKAKDIYQNTIDRIWGDNYYYNREGGGFDLYVREVQKDIRDLRHFMSLSEFERNQDPTFSFLIKKYRSNYSPSASYKFFSDENKLEYCYLRVEVDEILEKSGSDFPNPLF